MTGAASRRRSRKRFEIIPPLPVSPSVRDKENHEDDRQASYSGASHLSSAMYQRLPSLRKTTEIPAGENFADQEILNSREIDLDDFPDASEGEMHDFAAQDALHTEINERKSQEVLEVDESGSEIHNVPKEEGTDRDIHGAGSSTDDIVEFGNNDSTIPEFYA